MAVGPPPESEEIKSEEQTADEKRGKKKSKLNVYHCEVKCLDGSIVKADVEKTCKGEVLFNTVADELKIKEKEYVALMFKNEKGVMLWLDIHKEMKHQIGDHSNDIPFQFRVKFYEPEPSRIQDNFLRYLFYLQMREDITEGKLKCHENTYAILGSYTAQAEIGDFNLHTHDHDYLNDYVFAPEQTSVLVKRIHELHKEHRGQTPAQAEINFLEVAKKIPRYGVDVHRAKDNEGDVEIGVAAIGVYIYRYSKKEYLFRWQIIDAVLYNRRKYTVKLKEAVPKTGEESAAEDAIKSKKKPQLTHIYYFDSATKCKQCYKSSVEYHTFFRLARPDAPRKKADSLKIGSSFRYSDRTLYQLRHRPKESPAADVPFTRTPSKRRSTNTPRGSWNPDDEHLKDRDAGRLENGLPLVDEEPLQYEEIEIDETNPDDEKFDPEEWEVIEKKLPDGTLKRYRRRVIPVIPAKRRRSSLGDSPLDSEPYLMEIPTMNGSHKVPVVDEPMLVAEEQLTAESAPVDFEEPPIAMYMEEVEIDEKNPEDSWYDPSEWDVVERTMPDGTKKRYRVRMVEAETPTDENMAVIVEHDPMEMEEVEIDEDDPEDANYDPKEWDVVEKQEPDGTKKRFRRRYLITRLKCVPKKPDNALIDEPLVQLKEVDMDEAHPDSHIFNPDEWEVAEVVTPEGEKKKVRRTIVLTRVVVVPKKPSEIDPEEPIGIVEEVPIDEAHPFDDDKYDPTEWEVCEKTLPDGRKQPVRRRVIVTKLEYVKKKPSDIPADEPLAIVEEVDINEARPEPFDSNEWEVAEKKMPDGTTKPVRRRVLVNRIHFVKKKPAEVGINESLAAIEEIDIDEETPEDYKYDPSEWETVEKELPNGETVPVRRRIVITRYHTIFKKPSEIPPSEPLTELEEVDFDPMNPEDDLYDPNEWEMAEKILPDGTHKPVRRRMVVTRVEYVHKKPSDVTTDEQPVAQLEEVDIDDDETAEPIYDPNEWEIIGKTTPDGKQKKVRRRYIIRRVHVTHKKPSEVPPGERRARVEEVEIDEMNPDDDKFDPNQWEIVEKTSPGCRGKVKRVRRRIVVTRVSIVHRMPSEISPEDPLKAAIKDENVDPKEWEVAKITLANGEKKTGRRRYLVPHVTTEYKKPSEVPPDYPLVQVEEEEISPRQVDEQQYDPEEWDLMDKILPNGTTQPVLRRYKIQAYKTEHKKPSEVSPKTPLVEVEEFEIDPLHRDDGLFDPDQWEICDKEMPDGTKKPVRRRYLVTSRQTTYKKPEEAAGDAPHVEVEEALIDPNRPDDDKYDPAEWDVVEKLSPDGECKRYRCRIKVTKVAKVYFKPSAVNPEDEPDAVVEEVEMDGKHPENDDFDPKEWDIIDKPMPDGTTKRVRRRFVVTRVEIVLKKPSELTDDEPEGIAVEEVPLDDPEHKDTPYDPKEWEVVEKTTPDGEKKKVRRRIVVKCVTTQKKPFIGEQLKKDIPIVVEEVPMLEHPCMDEVFATPDYGEYDLMPQPRHGKKIIRRRSIKTTITPVGGRSVSVSTEEVPKQTEEVEIDESDPQDDKYDPKEWEIVEKRFPDGTVKRYRHRVLTTVITSKTMKQKYNEMGGDGSPVRMEEFEIDDKHPDYERMDPSECEILDKTMPDGSHKRYSRRIISSALPGSEKENEPPALWEEVEIDESNPDDEKFDPEEWEVLEKTLPDGSKKRFRRRNLNVITVHKKPIAITAGDAPLRVQEVEINEDVDEEFNLDDWEVVEKTMPDGRKKKFHRKILTTIFSSLNEKNEMIENPPIHIEEVEIYEVSSDEEDDAFSPSEWKIVEKMKPDGSVTKVRSRSSTTVITPKDTMKLEDKTVEEAPITAEEIELDESSPHEHSFDPEEWDIIERKLPDGTTKRFHRRIIRKYKRVPSNPNLVDEPTIAPHKVEVQEAPVEEYELDESNPEEIQKYCTPEWEIIEKTMPDGTVKRFRRKIITTVITTVTTKTIVVHPDGTEEVVDVETTPGEETTLESIDGGLESVTENFMKNLHPEDEPVIQPLLEENLESGIEFDMDNLLSEIDEISKSLSDDEAKMGESDLVRANLSQKQKDEAKLKKLEDAVNEEEKKNLKRREEDMRRMNEHNATISSIFDIDDAEYNSSPRRVDDNDDDYFEFASADVDFGEPQDSKVRTASVLKQKKIPERHSSSEDDPKKVLSLDRRYLKRDNSDEPPRSHSAVPRMSSPDDEYLPRCHSSAGVEQGDVFQPHEGGAEILYTVRDVSEVEQGQGGFVQSIKERHETLATEEKKDIQRDSTYLDDGCMLPKGLVHTHSVNYHHHHDPEIKLTKNPPSVDGVPTVIIPASSELPEEEIVYEISQSPVESHPDLLSDVNDIKIPEVQTHPVVFEEKTNDDDIFVRDPGVETRTVQIVPVTESYTMQHETIHDVSGTDLDGAISPNNRCQLTTFTMPTEVITKTITVEGDSSTMSREELQEIIRRSGSSEDILDDPNVASTHVTTTVRKVITGQTITVVGDDEEELQKAIDEAVKNATACEEVEDDGTIVLTAVQQYDEDGNIVNTELVGGLEGSTDGEVVVQNGTEI